jgi:hypothetical protein
MKHKTRDIRTWKKEDVYVYFSVHPPPTSIHLSHLFISASKPAAQESFDCCFSYSCTLQGIICDFRMYLREFLDSVVNRFTRQTRLTVNRKHSSWISLRIESFCPQRRQIEECSSVVYIQVKSSFWLLKPASEHEHAYLLPRLSWRWIVLLPSETRRKTITSVTAVFLPFMICLLTLPRTNHDAENTN